MFNTFIKDYNESTAFQIKEFKNYLSIIFNEKQKESQAEDIQKERNSIRHDFIFDYLGNHQIQENCLSKSQIVFMKRNLNLKH